MVESPEHKFLKEELDRSLAAFADTGLFGVTEADRRKFDYACRFERDFSRPMVAQVCWSNVSGIHKDLEMLLVGDKSPVKLYLLPDTQKARLRLDEAIGRYRDNAETRGLLKGFRFLAMPADFDADNEVARMWMGEELKRRMCADLLFGVVFGRLNASDVKVFAAHGGPLGLKFALLDCVSREPISSFSEIHAALGIKSNSSIREALVMLTATGLLGQKPRALPWYPTLKGRFLLDLVRRLLCESIVKPAWSNELQLILAYLGIEKPRFVTQEQVLAELRDAKTPSRQHIDWIAELIGSGIFASHFFGVNPLEGVDPKRPLLHSEFEWRRFQHLLPERLTIEDFDVD